MSAASSSGFGALRLGSWIFLGAGPCDKEDDFRVHVFSTPAYSLWVEIASGWSPDNQNLWGLESRILGSFIFQPETATGSKLLA